MKKFAITFSFLASSLIGCSDSETFNGRFETIENSVVDWKGSSPDTFNTGSFDVNSTDILFEDGELKSATFIMPVASIKNFNIENPDVRTQLLNHLMSPDFFNIALNPESKFIVTNVTELDEVPANAVEGSNYIISGNFTMCGITKPLSIPAMIEIHENALTIESKFTIDRTKWGMSYAADPALGPHHILPDVELHLKLKATRK